MYFKLITTDIALHPETDNSLYRRLCVRQHLVDFLVTNPTVERDEPLFHFVTLI
jgi:hypothetical protein